jgi:hypothetical protein
VDGFLVPRCARMVKEFDDSCSLLIYRGEWFVLHPRSGASE